MRREWRAHTLVSAALIVVACAIGRAQTPAKPQTPAPARAQAPPATYVWYGQFEALNETAKSATIKAQVRDHVTKYVKQFKSGDGVVIVWDMIGKKESDTVLALWTPEDVKKPELRRGYILPVQFVSAEAGMISFTLSVPDKFVPTLKSAKPGQWLKVTAPMEQPGAQAAVTSIQPSEKPQPAPAPQAPPQPKAPESEKK